MFFLIKLQFQNYLLELNSKHLQPNILNLWSKKAPLLSNLLFNY